MNYLSYAILLLASALIISCGHHQTEEKQWSSPAHNKDPNFVVGKTWQWVETVTPIQTVKATTPANYHFTLSGDGKVQYMFDCNRGNGSYTIAEGRLSFSPAVSTRMACRPNSQASEYQRDIERIKSFFIKEGDLYLEMPVDGGTMRFVTIP